MAKTEGLPADPFAAIEEANLQRDIAAVEWQKSDKGITWAQYLGSTIELLAIGDFSSAPLIEEQVRCLEELVPDLKEAERLESPDFPGVKRQVVQTVQDTMRVQRELMDI